MQHYTHTQIPAASLERFNQAEALLKEHFDDVMIAVSHQETNNIKVSCKTPYAGLGMLPTVQQKLRASIEQAEMTQLLYEETYELDGDSE